MNLTELQELNLAKIQEHLSIVAAGHPMSAIGEEMQFLSEGFQARAIFHLLIDFDTAAFSINLQRSAHARRFFLRKSREQNSMDRIFVALSRTDALLDCIVGGEWSLAPQIHQLSPPKWMPEGEYGENFTYFSLIHAYVAGVLGKGDPIGAKDWLSRLTPIVKQISDSDSDVCRLALCTHFLGGDEKEFWSRYENLVEISGEAAEAVPLDDGRVFDFPWLEASRHVSIELLAWMALARQRGFRPPEREYKRCPSAGWIDTAAPAVPDLFSRMELQFGL